MSDKAWGGRFACGVDEKVEAYTESVSFDRTLYYEDIQGSTAHVKMLAAQGILEPAEAEAIIDGLTAVLDEIEQGEFDWREDREDVHLNIEARLTELIGPVGGKLHTARSRNDQVALDFRLRVRSSLTTWRKLLRELIATLVKRADEHRRTLLPGFTHLQPAQPLSLAHHLLAYAWMFKRDCERVGDCLKRVNVSPLGAAALAGSTFPVDPHFSAKELEMPAVFDNSLDAVSDRDFALEAIFAGSTIMLHLSRLCEEIILWATPAFGFIALPDAYATGSSIMPQKKNPDVAELMRGKTGRALGSLTSLAMTLKGLPLAYNRDMQEDKLPFFDVDEQVASSLDLAAGMLGEIVYNEGAMRDALRKGFVNATELADYLAAKGMPFREAHHATGKAVAAAEGRGVGLEDLALDELRSFSNLIEDDIFEALAFETAVKRRESHGGTGPESVKRQMGVLRAWLENEGR